jgi:decaprenyl-phosphate phosphoribosyltransferase
MPAPPRQSTLSWPAGEAPLTATVPTDGAPSSCLDAPVVPLVPRRRGWALAALVTARPKQWVKNLLVIAAAGAAGALGHDDVPGRVGLACLAFCLISAGIYAINDVRDIAEDRRHPRKRFRPVAAGELDTRDAVLLGSAWLLGGLILCFEIRALLGAVGIAYIALTLSYTWIWRRIIVLDIIAIAGGFVLRALAGGVAAPVALSRWFVMVVTCVALFVAAGKRYAELTRTGRTTDADRGAQAGGRHVLTRYSLSSLRVLLIASGAGALFAYCAWAFGLLDVDYVTWRLLTVIPFTACLLRYGAIVRAGGGEAPEETLLSDRRLAIGGVAWLLLFVLSVHAAG